MEDKGKAIIAMSANAYTEDVKESIKVGMNEHLPKTINPSKMYANIGKWI